MLSMVSCLEEDELFCHLLHDEGKRRRQRSLPRPALCNPTMSQWAMLCGPDIDQALIATTGFDHHAFRMLLAKFKPWFETREPWVGLQDGVCFAPLHPDRSKGGRKRLVSAEACFGLVLSSCRFRGTEFILQGWFGFAGSHCNVWLRFGRQGSIALLWGDDAASIKMPTADKIAQLCQLTNNRHNMLTDVYCVADGLKSLFQTDGNLDEQSMFYNGWTHDHYITNLFTFSTDGRIIHAVINAPGSLHDSSLATWGGLYDTLEEVHSRTGGKCCVDSAFATNEAPHLIKSAQSPTGREDARGILQLQQATSLRQAAEWGMGAIQSAFPKMKDRIKIEENGERRVVLHLLPLLYNCRLEHVGLNQIRNTCCPHWGADARCFIY